MLPARAVDHTLAHYAFSLLSVLPRRCILGYAYIHWILRLGVAAAAVLLTRAFVDCLSAGFSAALFSYLPAHNARIMHRATAHLPFIHLCRADVCTHTASPYLAVRHFMLVFASYFSIVRFTAFYLSPSFSLLPPTCCCAHAAAHTVPRTCRLCYLTRRGSFTLPTVLPTCPFRYAVRSYHRLHAIPAYGFC